MTSSEKRQFSWFVFFSLLLLIYSISLLPTVVVISQLDLNQGTSVEKVIEILFIPHFYLAWNNSYYYEYFIWCETRFGNYDPVTRRASLLHCFEVWSQSYEP